MQISWLLKSAILLADILEDFRKMCIEIYELDPAKFPSAPRLVWQEAVQKTKVNCNYY